MFVVVSLGNLSFLSENIKRFAQTYAIRRIKDAFRENKNITDSEKIEELLNKAKANLQVIERQVC
uniref:Complex 1 LYR protein domain-containing protein n=1 Tax=Serinus canaria TaxID=9135 RepID=A0A8C9KTT2_SERCA